MLRSTQITHHSSRSIFAGVGFPGLLVEIGLGQAVGDVDFGQVGCEVFFDGQAFRFGGDVGPFLWVGLFVVEFFIAVGVANVAPLIGADSVIVRPVGADGGTVPRGFWIF